MTRRKVYKLSAVAVVLGVVGAAWGGRHNADTGPKPSDFPDLWQWDLTQTPVPDGANGIRLIMRTRHHPPTAPAPVPINTALRAGYGVTDKVIGSDSLVDGLPDDSSLALQLIDLRQLGLSAPEAGAPLRLQAVLRLYESRMKVVTKVNGHSVRGRPVVHAGGWVNDERPLLSFTTAGAGGHDEYTFLLSTKPGFE